MVRTEDAEIPTFHRQYSCVVEKYRTEGFSRQVPDDEVGKLNPVWYLHHTELRVVFDCASRSGRTLLNE